MEDDKKYTKEVILAALDALDELKAKEKKSDVGCLALIGILTIMFFNVVIFTILQGYIFTSAWEWFVVPFGVSAIGFWHAYGIAMTVKLFARGIGKAEKTENADNLEEVYKAMKTFALQTIGLLFVWLVLYATHCMM
jgi:hypothetical protein